MTALSGYELETLRKGLEFDLYRGRQPGDTAPILVVAAGPTRQALANIRKLEHEYSLADELDPTFALRPLALARHAGHATLVFADPGGNPLDRLLGQPLEITRVLRIAAALAAALRHVHERGLIHKDIKPSNVFVDAADNVRITGFGIASRLLRERQAPGSPEVIAGTLAYMAPEQTGRMNRSVDARSDLYSFGVTLYEMLTGVLPFTAADPMELIHCHIAGKPLPPGDSVSGLPEPVQAIVLKLLAKNAEDRYQTAAGVEVDLRRCLVGWTTHGGVAPFALGEHDRPDRLLIPEKLYGREAEIERLVAVFDRVATCGTAELVLVSGYAGIGKSSIVNELHKVLVPPRGLFAAGKFDQFRRNIPYATLAQAFQSLVRQLLGKSDAELRLWRDELRDALGPSGQLMVTLIPEVALIIGEQPPVAGLEPQDAQARFHLVFRRFVRVFAQPDHPLVLFLDDLQWVDTATLELIERLVIEPEMRNLLLIGAYRDNEVSPAHPLMRALGVIRSGGGRVSQIVLAPLAVEDLRQLMADTLHAQVEHVHALAALVHEKTGGNPFFTIQFVATLAEEGLLVFDRHRAEWWWEMDRIRAKGITDNLADFMAAKLSRLPNRTQTALGQLACLGNVAELATVAMAHGAPEEEMHTGLRDAVQTGLVFRTNGTYTFVHDRVREAAYALFPEEERVAAHLCLGRVLVSRTDPMLLDEKIFEIVDQLNRGAALIDSPQDREQLARLDLLAGKRAKTSTAYDSALAYFAMGRDLLLSDRRDATHRLSFELELQMAECEFMTGELTTAEERLLALRAHAADVGQLADVVCLALLLYFTTGRSERAAQISFEFLERVGITWSAHPTDEEVGEEYHRMLRKLERRPIETLVDLPAMSDPTCLATMNVLTGLFPAAFYVDRNLLELVLLRMTNISLKWGNGDGSSVAYAALNMVLGPRFGDYLTAYRFGQLACDLVDRRGLDRFKARVYSCVGSFSMPWTRPLPACRPLLRFAFDAGSAIGDLAFAAYTYRHLITNLLVSGEPLAAVQLEAEEALAFARKARLGLAAEHFIGQLPLIRALRGLAPEAASAPDPAYSDAWGAPQLEKHPHLAMAVCFHWIFALQECFFRQDYAAGIEAADRAGTLLWSTRSCFEAAEYHFYGALTRAAVCDCAPEGQRERHLEALHNHYGQITGWAQNCPENFGNRAALIGAEIARLDGRDLDAMRLYEVAVASARERHVTQNEGLGNELAARFYAARGFETIAVTYRRSARSCYVRWGATGKVRQLDRLHPDLQEPPTLPGPTVTFGAPVDHLDVGTMFKASQALSGEIVLGKLIETLMRITVQHAGAERGVLILIRDGEPRIAAEAATCEGKVNVTLREETVSSQDLPESALHYVLRSRQSLILDDAMLSDICSGDEYVQQRRPKSVLCIPIIKQAGLVGALYLENNLTRRAFTPERITVLEFLAAQAAISLENACLYAGLQRSEAFLAEAQRMSSIGSWNWKIASGRAVWSAEHYRILGRDPGLEPFPSYRMFIEIVHPEDRAALEQKLQAAVRERARLAVDYRIVLADGTIKHLHSVGRPMVDESGEVRDYVGSTMDVSERKHAEDALRDAQAELAHVARLTTMGELAASIAHEVNQPLAAIVTNAESCLLWLAKERPDLDRVRKAAERIVRTGHHASDVIKSIRAMLRKGSPAISQLDLNGAITDVLDLMRNELSRHEVALETELCADLERITGDRVQLQQVIVNLVKNGIEALSGVLNRARLLRVTTTLDANGCVLTAVADSGKGLDAPTMSRIFEPFFTTRREGMGMGLSICRSIVEAHGGRLWASCRSPHGSVFQFTLPPPSESPFQTWNGNAPS